MKLIDNLIKMSELSDETYNILVEEFNSNPLSSFNEISKFHKLCDDKKIQRENAERLYNVLSYLLRFLIQEKGINEGLQKFESTILANYKGEIDLIWRRIRNSVPKLEGFINHLKERDLNNTSNGIDSFKVICDVRPLFDIERKNITKYTFPILVSFETKTSNKKLVFEISENDLITMNTELEIAIKKLSVLKSNFSK